MYAIVDAAYSVSTTTTTTTTTNTIILKSMFELSNSTITITSFFLIKYHILICHNLLNIPFLSIIEMNNPFDIVFTFYIYSLLYLHLISFTKHRIAIREMYIG